MEVLFWIFVLVVVVGGGIVYFVLRNRSIEVGRAVDRIKSKDISGK